MIPVLNTTLYGTNLQAYLMLISLEMTRIQANTKIKPQVSKCLACVTGDRHMCASEPQIKIMFTCSNKTYYYQITSNACGQYEVNLIISLAI